MPNLFCSSVFLTLTLLAVVQAQAEGPDAAEPPSVSLVATTPIETSLDHSDLPATHEVWVEMIEGASERIRLAHFYASNHPTNPSMGRLEAVILALEAAAGRGVLVQFLAEKKFYETYPNTLDRLDARESIEVRLYDVKELMGGVLHAKMMTIDDREAFVGSQNFDWRALEHIQELGMRVRIESLVSNLNELFDWDWALAADPTTPRPKRPEKDPFPVLFSPHVVASPEAWLLDDADWDLPQIVELIDKAKKTVRVQLLSYGTLHYSKYFSDIDVALRRAAARGVQVEIICSNWAKRERQVESIQSLQAARNITVKFINLPEWSGGFIPFARVVHAKYMIVDSAGFWLGTSNWSYDYFYRSRNVGLIVAGLYAQRNPELIYALEEFFAKTWNSEYAETVDPSASYEPPRRSR